MWNCENFKKMSVDMRWNVAKEQKCLRNGHRGEACSRRRVCGLNRCRSHHHRMLHEDPKKEENTEAANVAGSREVHSSSTLQVGATTGGESEERTHMYTTTTGPGEVPSSGFVTLRTVPVYITNHHQRIKVNALLDDGSSGAYLNGDIAAELGLEGTPHELTVNVSNENQENLATSVVEFMISSSDGKVSKLASTNTAERVNGSMQVVDWSRKHKWKNLNDIKFPQAGTRPILDLLIGVDHADLLYSLEDVTEKVG